MTDRSPSAPANESGRAIIAFLDKHRLAHSPENFSFVHRYFDGTDEGHFFAVNSLIKDGVRLNQSDIHAIAPTNDLRSEAGTIGDLSGEVMGIIGETAQEANAFSKSLVLAATELTASAGSLLPSAVARMIAATERAEERLSRLSLHTAMVRERLRGMGINPDVDSGTLLLNRMAIDAILTAALGRQGETVLALVSLDQLTAVGATHGIGVAERVLRALGETLRDHCLPHRVGRWEAKHLAVVFDAVDISAAWDMLDAARKAFGKRTLKRAENQAAIGKLTFSSGLASTNQQDREGLILAAGERLSKAIARQGNVVVGA